MSYIKDFINEYSDKIYKKFKNEKYADLFANTMNNTLDTTIKYLEDGTVFVLTGDIPAMWLRDSVCQVRPFLIFCKDNEGLQRIIEGVLNKHYQLIQIDPYANAFNESDNNKGHQNDITDMDGNVWERKYEIDSLCYTIQLAYLYYKITGNTEHINNEFVKTVTIIMDLWETEQNHSEKSTYTFERPNPPAQTDTLQNGGKGTPVDYTGMTWSGFRPSDDACTYGYLVPSNFFAHLVLGYLEELFEFVLKNDEIKNRAKKLKEEIFRGIENYAITEFDGKKIYAYETDGMGNYLLMDDANVPSLLALPFLGVNSMDKEIYENTRKFVLSKNNPYYYEGKVVSGIGSPHTPTGYVWHISMAIEGLTSDSIEEKIKILDSMANTDAGTGLMHESFDPNNPSIYTREWFSWANSMFCELMLDCCDVSIKNLLK